MILLFEITVVFHQSRAFLSALYTQTDVAGAELSEVVHFIKFDCSNLVRNAEILGSDNFQKKFLVPLFTFFR